MNKADLLKEQAQRLRKRIATVKREGPAWHAYRAALDEVKRKMAALRNRLIVESPDAE